MLILKLFSYLVKHNCKNLIKTQRTHLITLSYKSKSYKSVKIKNLEKRLESLIKILNVYFYFTSCECGLYKTP